MATCLLGRWGEELLAKVEETGYRAVYPSAERAVRALAALGEWEFSKKKRPK